MILLIIKTIVLILVAAGLAGAWCWVLYRLNDKKQQYKDIL